jgi:hypothetical protein
MTDQEKQLRSFYFRWIKRSLLLFFAGAFIALMPRSLLERFISEPSVVWVWFFGWFVAVLGCVDYTGLVFQRKKIRASFDVVEKFNLKPIHPTFHFLKWWRTFSGE